VPGPFLTDISKAWDLEAFEQRARTAFALGRGGEPHEIVGAALYLASNASSYTTGPHRRRRRAALTGTVTPARRAAR
jgi:NAD(P)-dependent dehydrogenase (short-subunit alcohol dehydrogenase family)